MRVGFEVSGVTFTWPRSPHGELMRPTATRPCRGARSSGARWLGGVRTRGFEARGGLACLRRAASPAMAGYSMLREARTPARVLAT